MSVVSRSSAALSLIAGLILGLLLAPGPAQGANAEAAYDQAVAAFNKGDYARALDGFLKARAMGMDRSVLHFNIGSSYYRLGRYDEARPAFLAAARDPDLATLAYYNLGLTAYQQHDTDAARRWFARTLDAAPERKLRELARGMLRRTEGAAASRGLPPWSAVVLAEAGYDDNVTLQSDAETITSAQRGDAVVDVFGHVQNRWLGTVERGASLDASAYLSKHRDLGQYDIGFFQLGGGWNRRIGRWYGDLGAHLDYSYLDGSGFTRSLSLKSTLKRSLSAHQRIDLQYEISRIDELQSAYDYLAGWRHQAAARSSWQRGAYGLQLTYALEVNDRADRPSPLFTSFSPLRHEIRAKATAKVTPKLSTALELQFRHSEYADANELPDGTTRSRVDNRPRLIAGLSWLLPSGRDVTAEFTYTDNRSNVSAYSYQQRQYMLSTLFAW